MKISSAAAMAPPFVMFLIPRKAMRVTRKLNTCGIPI